MMRRSGSPVRRPLPPRPRGLFLEDQKGGGLRKGLLLAPEFRLEMTDAVPVAALEPLEPGLAGGHGVVGLLAGKTPALDLFGVEPIAAAVFGKRVGTEACAVKDGSELLAGGPALGSLVMVGKQSPGLTGLPAPQVEGGGTDALLGSNPGDRFTCGPAEAGKNSLPAFRWNGFHGIELISRSSSTPHLESQLRSLDNYPDTGGYR